MIAEALLNLRDPLTAGYVECLLWAESGDPESALGEDAWIGDIGADLARMIALDVEAFRVVAAPIIDDSLGSWEQAGHDLWLTRNGHGAGFWDRPELWGKGGAAELTSICKRMGEVWLYRGDDGVIYS